MQHQITFSNAFDEADLASSGHSRNCNRKLLKSCQHRPPVGCKDEFIQHSTVCRCCSDLWESVKNISKICSAPTCDCGFELMFNLSVTPRQSVCLFFFFFSYNRCTSAILIPFSEHTGADWLGPCLIIQSITEANNTNIPCHVDQERVQT